MLRHELKILGKNGPRSRQARWCVFKRRPQLNGESLCVRQKTNSERSGLFYAKIEIT
jgi:hypothetical protein